jgi:hypothetical protein
MSRTLSGRHCMPSDLATVLTAGGDPPARTQQAPLPLTIIAARLRPRDSPSFYSAATDPGLALYPGRLVLCDLCNRAGEEIAIHWHGQSFPAAPDGVTGSVAFDADKSKSAPFTNANLFLMAAGMMTGFARHATA